MEQEELDTILQVVENPVRRKIIKRLSQEPAYALQLSKELSLGQPLVAKHLVVMEHAGLVSSAKEASPAGPPRKKYSLAKGVTITMDVGPNVFLERGMSLRPRPAAKSSEEVIRLRRMLDRAIGVNDGRKRLTSLSEVLSEVDIRMEGLESERADLLDVRNQAMREASRIAENLAGRDMRRVLFHILNEHNREVRRISEALNIREFSVKEILDELERNYFG
ncbi:MAG TPA: ArsR family transcriptional regulator [Nitrososphaerales archaeon]|nr:ArsR family transcriptional regulator [Nitrososphaerales archaeon]